MMFRGLVLSVLASLALAKRQKYIAPGAIWRDTDGEILSAHAGGVYQLGDTWYWFGQNEREDHDELFAGLNVYSSKDLTNWKFEGPALSPVPGTAVGPETVVERPKVVFSKELNQWILWFHSDNNKYQLLRQGVAMSPNITGPYTFYGLVDAVGGPSQDLGMFVDDDGQAYALYSNGDAAENHDQLIVRLSSNFTGHSELVYKFLDWDLEAPMIIRTPQKYYAVMSHKTGYRPNNVEYYSADKLEGPWSAGAYIAPAGTRTFNSQSTFNFRIKGKEKTSWIYGGDMWATADILWDSRYFWSPVHVNDEIESLSVEWHDLFTVNVETGEFGFPKGERYEAEAGTLKGDASVIVQPNASKHKIVSGLTSSASSVTINGIHGTGKPQWVSLHYHNHDALWGDNRGGNNLTLTRYATVSVNGQVHSPKLRQPSGSTGFILTNTLNVTFEKGSKNSITLSGWENTRAADLDDVTVYGNIYAEDDEDD